MSFNDDLNNVSGGKRLNDRSYDLTKEAALAYAKQLGDELGKNFLDKWMEHQIAKVTESCKKVTEDYEKWNNE